MAITAAAIATFLTPIVEKLVAKAVSELSKKLFEKGKEIFKGKITQFLIEKELNDAINKKTVEEFIKKYSESLTDQMTSQIRTIADLRDSFYKVEQILKKKQYSEEAANEFIDLARKIETLSVTVPFTSAGIVLKVKDAETKKEITVKDENYTIAMLLRFAAAAWTQIAHKNTPELDGITISYDADVKVVFRRPRVLREKGPKKGRIEREESLAFSSAYNNLMDIYSDADAISSLYLNTVSCLKAAQIMMDRVSEEQERHNNMTLEHLKGLAICFRGEAQYWIFNISDKLPTILKTINEIVGDSKAKAKELVIDGMGKTEEELKQFLRVIEIYKDIPGGLAGAQQLLKKGADFLIEGKEKERFNKRVQMVSKIASGTPVIVVDEPKPIL